MGSFSDLTPDEGTVDNGNSTTTSLLAGATFTGEWVDASNFAAITVFIYTDQDSADLGGILQFSTDQTNIDLEIKGTYTGNIGHPVTLQPQARYFRFKLTNGTTDQTEFRLQTILRRTALTDPHLRVGDHIPTDITLPIQRNVITGLSTAGGGSYENVKVTPSGAVVVEGSFGEPHEEFLETSSGSRDMNVDGCTVPVEFEVHPQDVDWVIDEFYISALDSEMEARKFLGTDEVLTNGLLVEIKTNDSEFSFNITITHDMVDWASGNTVVRISDSGGDSIKVAKTKGITLKKSGTFGPAANDDYVRITVRDDIEDVIQLRAACRGRLIPGSGNV